MSFLLREGCSRQRSYGHTCEPLLPIPIGRNRFSSYSMDKP